MHLALPDSAAPLFIFGRAPGVTLAAGRPGWQLPRTGGAPTIAYCGRPNCGPGRRFGPRCPLVARRRLCLAGSTWPVYLLFCAAPPCAPGPAPPALPPPPPPAPAAPSWPGPRPSGTPLVAARARGRCGGACRSSPGARPLCRLQLVRVPLALQFRPARPCARVCVGLPSVPDVGPDWSWRAGWLGLGCWRATVCVFVCVRGLTTGLLLRHSGRAASRLNFDASAARLTRWLAKCARDHSGGGPTFVPAPATRLNVADRLADGCVPS